MIKEAMEYLLDINGRGTVIHIDNRPYSIDYNPIYEPTVPTLDITTLTGFIDYINNLNGKDFESNEVVIFINDYRTVFLKSNLFGSFKQRNLYVVAKCNEIGFDYTYQSLEKFIINLQSKFIETSARENILKLISNITDENIKISTDDGTSQEVVVKSGISLSEKEKVEHRISLKPYRTFLEVNQPESDFIFRIKKSDDKMLFSLFEADGGAWKNEAMLNIKEYLEKQLKELNINIPVIA